MAPAGPSPAPSIAILMRNGHLEADAAGYDGLAAAGFTEIQPGHGIVLRNLGEDGARPSEIAAKAQVTRQAIAKVVDDLERTYAARVGEQRWREVRSVLETLFGAQPG